jgi:hypothetical protein
MSSKDKNLAKEQQLLINDASPPTISSPELEEETRNSPLKDTILPEAALVALGPIEVRTSARQAAQKLSETDFVNSLLQEGPSRIRPPTLRVPGKPAIMTSSAGKIAQYKATLATKSMIAPSKKARITSYLQASPKPLPTPAQSRLPVGTIKAIEIATQLAPHIAEATTALEYEARLRQALADMQLQLEQQRIKTALDKDKSEALLMQLQLQLQASNQQLENIQHTSKSQPIHIPSTSRSQAAPMSPSTRQHTSPVSAQLRYLLRSPSPSSLPDPLTKIKRSAIVEPGQSSRPKLTATDIGIRAHLTRKETSACTRCGYIHEYVDDLCTSITDTNGRHCISLSQEEQEHRILIKITHQFPPTPLQSPRGPTPSSTSTSIDNQNEQDQYNTVLQQHIRNLTQQPAPSPSALARSPKPATASLQTTKLSCMTTTIPVKSVSASVPTLIHGSSSAPGAASFYLTTKAKSEAKRQQSIIDQAQLRLISLSQSGPNPIRKQSARVREKALALFTNDSELLHHGSTKIKSEQVSEDDSDEITAEQGDSIHCHNLMHPTSKVAPKNKLGYVNSPFIKPDDEDDSDDQDEPEQDDDPSSDYNDDASIERSAQLQELQSLRAATSAHMAEIATLRKAAADRQQAELQELQLLRATVVHTQGHGHQHGSRLQVALNPPVHGAWDDVAHLMRTYLPAYEKYQASCGNSAESIFSGYSLTEKKRLSKLFTKQTVDGQILVNISIEYLQTLSNEQFLALICKEKGYKTSTLTEDALKSIHWKGAFTDKANWINHETNWEECLAQTSAKGAIDKKRLISLYRESIPEPFIQKHLATKRFDNWQQAHRHMAEDQIKNPDFLIEWNENIRTRKSAPQMDRQQPKQTHSSSAATSESSRTIQPQSPTTHIDPLTYVNSYGLTNVNPNLIIDLDLNKSKTPCDRCLDGTTHRWQSHMCTSFKNKKGDIITPKQSAEENKTRLQARWHAGFFSQRDPNISKPPRLSPSVQDTAASTTQTANVLGKQ